MVTFWFCIASSGETFSKTFEKSRSTLRLRIVPDCSVRLIVLEPAIGKLFDVPDIIFISKRNAFNSATVETAFAISPLAFVKA